MERPSGVTILAVLSFLGAALMVLAACGMFVMGAAGAGWAARWLRWARLPAWCFWFWRPSTLLTESGFGSC